MTDHIKAIKDALEAGPTDWHGASVGDEPNVTYIGIRCGAIAVHGSSHGRKVNAAYIAACNPTAIRSLLSRLEEAERERDHYALAAKCEADALDAVKAELNDAKAPWCKCLENKRRAEEAEKDAERYRWLRKRGNHLMPEECCVWESELDDAIDAEIEKEQSND